MDSAISVQRQHVREGCTQREEHEYVIVLVSENMNTTQNHGTSLLNIRCVENAKLQHVRHFTSNETEVVSIPVNEYHVPASNPI